MLKFIDTSRDFWKERRAVWMSPPDGAEAPAAPETDVAPVEEESKPDLLEAKKTVFAAKVDGAKTMLEDLHKLYGLNEQGVDTNTSNDQAVNQLYDQLKPQLDGLVGRFETESAALTGATEQQLADLDAKLVTEVLDLTAGGNATELQAGIKEDVAGKAGVDTEKVDADLAKLKDAREKDKAAYDSANGKVAEFEKFITDFKEVYPSKNTAELTALVDGFKSVGEYAEGAGADVNPEILNTELAALEKSFAEKAATIAGTGYETAKMNVQEALSKLDASVPEESRRFAEGLLGNKNGPVTLDGGKVLGPEKMTEYGISDASGYQIASRLEQNDASGEAYLVMNYENAVLKQEFTDEAAFKKKYPEISLPEKGATSTANEVRFLSPAKPAPFGGIRRQRELEISVAQDGKISVKISNIMFGDPPKSEVHVPLRKHINDVKKVEDILYPSGYTREEGSNGTESDGSERGAEAGEELKSLEEYETMVSEYEKAYREMVKIEPGDPRLNELPKFLRDGFVFMQKSGIETFIKQAKGNIDDARTLDATSSKYNDKLLLIRDTTDEIAKYKDFMGDQNHSTLENLPEFKQIREGLTYGEDGYRPNLFEKHFKDAADVLDTHFYNRDKGHTGPYVEIVNAKMSSSQALHQLHGHFDVRVKGQYGDQPVRYEFKMMDTKNFTFEEAVANAMRKMVKDEDINKKIDEQKEKLDDKNETIDRVDRREARHLERRLRKMERLHEKHADWNDLRKAIKEDSIINKTADYEAKSEEDIRAEIIKDLGNPDDYEYFNFGDKFAAIRIVPRGASEPSGEFARAAGIDVAQVENAASDEAIKTAKEKGLLSGEDFAILESLSAAYPDDDAPKDAYYYEQMDPIIQKGLKYQEKAQELAELKKNIPELFRPDGQFIEKVDPDASYNLIKSGENGGIAIVEFDNFKDGDADGVYFIQNGKLIESPMPILEGIIIATLKYADGDKAISTAAENNLLTDPEKATLESHKDTPKDFSYYKEMASIVEKGLRYQVDPDSASLPTQEDDSDLADPTEEEVPAVIS